MRDASMRSRTCDRLRAAVLCAGFLLVIGVAGCSRQDEPGGAAPGHPASTPFDRDALVGMAKPTGLKVLLVGIDGASFGVMRPLIAQGKLPTFQRLIEEGTSGVLKSQRPMWSPAIWTTIVTGKDREEHGILGFRVHEADGRVRLVNANDRRVLALWNITPLFRIRNGWVSFWATWPAEWLNGWMVSDRLAVSRWTEWWGGIPGEGLTYPAALREPLQALVVDPLKPPMTEIDELVAFTDAERDAFLAFRKPIKKHGSSVFKFSYCSQRSYENIALHMLRRTGQPDLLGVFLIANDPICHTFWHYYRPQDFRGVDHDVAGRLGALVPNIYVHNDRYLARLLAELDDDTVVIIVSDHGFQSSGILPTPTPADAASVDPEALERIGAVTKGNSGIHHIDGVFIACGGPVKQGGTTTASVADVTPTVLALLGLPVAKDMSGRALESIFEAGFLAAHPVQTIDSYEPYVDRSRPAVASGSGEGAVVDQLKALGYVE